MAEPTTVDRAPHGLSDEQLAALVTTFAGAGVHGIVPVGSDAHGDADAFSDVDFNCFVHQGPKPRDWFGHRGGWFVTVFCGTVEEGFAELRRREAAIWAVPAFRSMRVLFNRRQSGAGHVITSAAGHV